MPWWQPWKAAAKMPTVVGTMLGEMHYVLTAIGGAGLGVGCMALLQNLNKKNKKDETVVEETTTTGE